MRFVKSGCLIYCSALLAVFFLGGCDSVQGDAKYDLRWEWPAGRQPEKTLLAVVDNIEKQGDDLFGIGRSPSIADNLPDVMRVSGRIIDSDGDETFSLVLPKLELGDIGVNDNVGLALIGDSVCICIAKAPQGRDPETLWGWLKTWDCATP